MSGPVRNQEPGDAEPSETIVDREFAGEHGTTALPGSLEEEEHPEVDPQTPGGALHKATAEAGEGQGVVDKAKRVLEEADRQFSGEYEGREEQPDVTSDRGER